VSAVFMRFEKDLLLRDAAGDLGVTPERLLSDLRRLDVRLERLSADQATITRADFTALYKDSLCRESSELANQPDPLVCANAASAAGNP
jgi:hypothetical protein